MENQFPFATFRPGKQDYLFRRSVTLRNFLLKRPEKACSIYFPAGFSVNFLSMVNNFFPVPSNSPKSRFESYLAPVSFSFLKWRIMGRIALWDCLSGGELRSRFLPQVYSQIPRRYVAQNQSYVAQTFIMLNNTLTSLLHISCACFVSSRLKERDVFHVSQCFVSSSLKKRGRFHVYLACFVSRWLKERDILHTLFIKLCFSVHYT